MAVYIVAYDLHKQGQNYSCITQKLESYSAYWHMQGSVWIVVSDKKATEIRDSLKACLDSNDDLFVGRLSGEAAWSGYGSEVTEWLKDIL